MFFGKNKNPASGKPKPPGELPPQTDVIFDVTEVEFEQRVLLASMERPVIVDFWAPWCGPCKQLTPVIEKAVTEAKGMVLLAKINIDENQQIAAALRIQSIPAVFAFFQGRPVDAFQGALPEGQIKIFIDKLIKIAKQAAPEAIDIPVALKQAGQSLAEGNIGEAQMLYQAILTQDETNVPAYVGFVRATIATGDIPTAKALIDHAPDSIKTHSMFAEALSAMELAQAAPSGSLSAMESAVIQNPGDHQARFDLALAQFTSGQKEQAIDSLIEIIRAKREWNEDAARKQLIKFFEALGPMDPLTVQGRRKLSSVLFS
jgi:putative thioredoxin